MARARSMTRDEAAALLGLVADADPATVRHAWRMWARIAHPDVGGDPEHFARLDRARRVLLQPLPQVLAPEPRADLSDVLRRPAHPAALALGAAGAIILGLLPALLGVGPSPLAIAVAALPAALSAAAWSAWATREALGPRADRGHRIALLGLAWLPVATAQQLLAAAAGQGLLTVLPVLALPLVAAVASVNPGAGLWRTVGRPGP